MFVFADRSKVLAKKKKGSKATPVTGRADLFSGTHFY
jgi:hypothetical protein